MKKNGTGTTKWLRGILALAGAALFVAVYPLLSPTLGWLLEQAAIFTTVLDMPTGAVETLRERYADSVLPSDYTESEEPPAPQTETPGESESPSELPAEEIPEEYRGTVSEVQFTGEETPVYSRWNNAWIRNYTDLTDAEIQKVLKTSASVRIKESTLPQVLIYHTHATESFEPYDSTVFDIRHTWRDSDNRSNMVAVGDVLAQGLFDSGVAVCHDDTQHDNPSYTGAYDRSAVTIAGYLKQYSSIRVLLDVHRDAIVYSDTAIAKTTATINGKKAAQLMIIAPCDDGSVGVPDWKENFRFAVELTNRIEEAYPGLTRPVFFCYRTYNFALSDGALLLEFGTNGNTLEEAQYTAQLIAPILAQYLSGK